MRGAGRSAAYPEVVAKTSIRIILDDRAINELAAGTADLSARRAATRTRDRAKANLTSSGRIRTGALRDSITARRQPSGDPHRVLYDVGSNLKYAKWQEDGRGPVRPIRAKVLRFQPKGSDVFIFRPYAGPAAGVHFLKRALDSLDLRDYMP